MLFKDNKNPVAEPQREAKRRVENSAPAQSHSTTDDFGAYNQPQRKAPPRQRPMPHQNAPRQNDPRKNDHRAYTFFDNFNRSSIIVALIAVVALIVLIGLIITFISNANKDIKYENDIYLSTYDDAGIWHILYNGRIIGEYANEIEMILAEDRSFAYIIENTPEGYLVHVAKGRKISTVTSTPVTKVLTTATLSPAVVWIELGNGMYLYTEEHGEERITKDYASLRSYSATDGQYNFICHISADGSTVTYSQNNPETQDWNLYIYRDSLPTKSGRYLTPVAVSDDGQFVFAYGFSKDNTKILYIISDEDEYFIDEGFEDVIALNADNNEIVYTTNTETGIATYIYSFNPRKLDDDKEPSKIGNGVCIPVSTDPDVARPSTFKKTYFERIDGDETSSPTYFLNKKYVSTNISSVNGTFTPDADYFYFIQDDDLRRIKLKDKSHTPETVTTDIVDFAITQKGNVYWLDKDGNLYFRDTAKENTARIADDVGGIAMHDYSNTLYYNCTESVGVYTTKEGSGKEQAKLGSVELVSLPTFTNPDQKKSYVAVWDPESETCNVFYTSNGKTFKQVTSCIEIPGINMKAIKNSVSGSGIEDPNQAVG